MFEEAIIKAVVAAIRTYLVDQRPLLCDITHNAAPPPGAEGVFYGIDSTGYRNDAASSLDCYVGIKIVITMWATFSPEDRLGTALKFKAETAATPNSGGLSIRTRRLIDLLHGQYAVNTAANAVLTGAGDDGRFVEPLQFKSVAYDDVDYQWLGCEPDDDDPPAGMKATLTFADARYEKRLD